MPIENVTKQAFNSVGASQGIGTLVVQIVSPGPGRYKIYGVGRHSGANGLRLAIGSTQIVVYAGAGGSILTFPTVVVDIVDNSNIIVELNVATATGETAFATIVAQRIG